MTTSLVFRFLLFLGLNFAALGIGGYFTGSGVPSEWYQSLAKAPWTPPGWVFGAAWTTIMIAFSVYMAWLMGRSPEVRVLWLFYGFQWILNVTWNPTFFYFHATSLALVLIFSLTCLLIWGFFRWWPHMGFRSLTLAPYIIWLLIATSLNAYVVWNNP